MRRFVLLAVVLMGGLPIGASAAGLHLVPQPADLVQRACSVPATRLLTVPAGFDPAARAEIDERWNALGIGTLRPVDAASAIVVRHDPALASQAYRLDVSDGSATIVSSDAAGAFYGAMTFAQLPVYRDGRWSVPCVRIADAPAMRWRILSDDVSRGPLPTMHYFEERIRTLAAFKFNGYSPYLENTFVSPTDPLPAPLDGLTPDQLRELAVYAARFHVALIPQQQTFAHMHGVVSKEIYADAAELPHGFLMTPGIASGDGYLRRVLQQELQAVPHPPFVHIGADETATLGLGRSSTPVDRLGRARVFADRVNDMARIVQPSGARVMLWDDALARDPAVAALLPKDAVIVNYHYGAGEPFAQDLARVTRAGFEQMVAPGAHNWDEIFPAVDTAIANERAFIAAGKAAGALGLFQTVWHDDGQSLYEATWYPILYAGAAAWQRGDLDPAAYAADFPSAFFGVDDARYARDVERLATILDRFETAPYDRTDALFWTDPFDPAADARMAKLDLRAIRLDAEAVESDLYFARPPLHRNAAFVMDLAARRYDALARKFQIASEVRVMYAQALAGLHAGDGSTLRDLYWSRYWMWELRDANLQLAKLYERAWRYESRDGHLDANLEQYRVAADRAIAYASAIYRATYDGFVRNGSLPPFESAIAP